MLIEYTYRIKVILEYEAVLGLVYMMFITWV